MNKVIIYTKFPDTVATLLETHYKRIVTPEVANLIGPIQVRGDCDLEFPYLDNGGNDQTLHPWIKAAQGCGLVTGYKLIYEQAEEG